MRRRWRYGWLLFCLVFLLAGCGEKGAGAPLKLTFLDTGKSDCIVIEAGESVVVNDTADADDAEAICAFLDERGKTRIAYLILSHFDKDHIGSAADLISRYEVGCVLMPDYEEDSEPYLALMQALAETDTAYERLKKDVSFSVEGVSFYVDAPDESVYENDNNYSLITCVINGKNRFLLMGDAKKIRTGEFLESDASKGRFDLIKMPHHGNYTKNLEALFATAVPRYAVLTADPERLRVEEETVALLNKYQCEVYYTDEGTVTAVSDGEQVLVSQP
ncbi:MAG: MBL fold metallo-hydrolase [Lachnospiraceae bacterium]|nr:MBL fold metallo-hydrolase [Lachnospiraceae bacterium]